MRVRASLAVVCLTVSVISCGTNPVDPTSLSIPLYAGTWTGTYQDTACTESPGLAAWHFCDLILVAEDTYSLTLTQTGRFVSATFTIGLLEFPLTSGTVGSDGTLSLNASSPGPFGAKDGTFRATLNLMLQHDTLTGTISQVWDLGTGGSIVFSGVITSAARLN